MNTISLTEIPSLSQLIFHKIFGAIKNSDTCKETPQVQVAKEVKRSHVCETSTAMNWSGLEVLLKEVPGKEKRDDEDRGLV